MIQSNGQKKEGIRIKVIPHQLFVPFGMAVVFVWAVLGLKFLSIFFITVGMNLCNDVDSTFIVFFPIIDLFQSLLLISNMVGKFLRKPTRLADGLAQAGACEFPKTS